MLVYYWQEQSFDSGESWQIIDSSVVQDTITINNNGQLQLTWRLSLDNQDNNIIFGLLPAGTTADDNYDYLK